ncbi:MFS transporter [Billgrantia diversa]|uniref:MFS transporter n=1 Tax=Halomonas sp. MCCC 1A13316 TaxID=2733487 RepID=UPI0018A445DE|nr:MFS transporter [Halomonas sp. MCCC 1A13316]QOR37935.1 MFS transporter [Halomonas sp. MCCC 1A13316]
MPKFLPPAATLDQPPASRWEAWIVVATTTWVQALTSAAMLLVPVLAPQIAADFGIPTGLVGMQVSLLYGIAMLVSLQAGSLARRLGACRSSQVAMALVMLGCAMAGGGTPAALLLTTLLLGVAYGLTNPAAAQLLARYTPLRHRNLLYSIKQSGVPLGGVLSGSLAPSLAHAWSWHAAFLVLSLAALVTGLALQLRRRDWDRDRAPTTLLRGSGSLTVLYRRPQILWLGMAGFCLAAAQLSLLSFTVAFMVEELLITLVTAGVIMSVVHASGVFGRVGWGMLADRLGRSVPVLCGLAVAMLVLFVAVSLLGPDTPVWLVIALLSAAGGTAIGWNGVYLSEVARRSPKAEVSEATAAVLVLTYMGVLTGPALFSVIVSLGGSYSAGFLLPMLASLLALFCLRASSRTQEVPSAHGIDR